jgi:hypothetical protein
MKYNRGNKMVTIDGRRLNKKNYDEMTDEEKFVRYGTSSWQKVDSQLARIEKVGFSKAMNEVIGRVAAEQTNITVEERASVIASKLVLNKELSIEEKQFLEKHKNEVLKELG